MHRKGKWTCRPARIMFMQHRTHPSTCFPPFCMRRTPSKKRNPRQPRKKKAWEKKVSEASSSRKEKKKRGLHRAPLLNLARSSRRLPVFQNSEGRTRSLPLPLPLSGLSLPLSTVSTPPPLTPQFLSPHCRPPPSVLSPRLLQVQSPPPFLQFLIPTSCSGPAVHSKFFQEGQPTPPGRDPRKVALGLRALRLPPSPSIP